MPVSYGEYIELERRVRELEDRIDLKAPARPSDPTGTTLRSTPFPSPPSSIAKATNVGTITFSWEPSPSPNISRYVIEIADNTSFVGAFTAPTSNLSYTYTQGDPGTTYYARVKAVNQNEASSDWTATLNTQTGTATFSNLSSGAANSITVNTQTSGFDPAIMYFDAAVGAPEGIYATTNLSLPTVADVIVFAFAKVDFSMIASTTEAGSTKTFIEVRVDGEVKQTYANYGTTSLGTASGGRLTVPGLGFPLSLAAGSHVFDIRLRTEGPAGAGTTYFIRPVEFTLALWEARR